VTPLAQRLAAEIAAGGPISVAQFMRAALYDPQHGYYATRAALGAEGDFTTAPEISQIFGELIGLWLVQVWLDLGAPAPFQLVELGPGRGVLMADALRAARVRPAFLEAARLTLVEVNPALREEQRARLRGHAVSHVARLEEAPPGPMLLLANEFLDCLPIRQFVRAGSVWREKLVGVGADGALRFGLSEPLAGAMPAAAAAHAPEGAVAEIAPELPALVDVVAERLHAAPGRALFIDYGYAATEGADTLQALARHSKVDPLAAPGEADLTAHVDFGALARLARERALQVDGPLAQGAFLAALGAQARGRALCAAHPGKAAMIQAGLDRLVAPEQMGTLFLAMALGSPGAAPAPGF
jgi:NADH dehydrogenase [ubiquinone] 1 alpha subcomplex assembly factor 7